MSALLRYLSTALLRDRVQGVNAVAEIDELDDDLPDKTEILGFFVLACVPASKVVSKKRWIEAQDFGRRLVCGANGTALFCWSGCVSQGFNSPFYLSRSFHYK